MLAWVLAWVQAWPVLSMAPLCYAMLCYILLYNTLLCLPPMTDTRLTPVWGRTCTLFYQLPELHIALWKPIWPSGSHEEKGSRRYYYLKPVRVPVRVRVPGG